MASFILPPWIIALGAPHVTHKSRTSPTSSPSLEEDAIASPRTARFSTPTATAMRTLVQQFVQHAVKSSSSSTSASTESPTLPSRHRRHVNPQQTQQLCNHQDVVRVSPLYESIYLKFGKRSSHRDLSPCTLDIHNHQDANASISAMSRSKADENCCRTWTGRSQHRPSSHTIPAWMTYDCADGVSILNVIREMHAERKSHEARARNDSKQDRAWPVRFLFTFAEVVSHVRPFK